MPSAAEKETLSWPMVGYEGHPAATPGLFLGEEETEKAGCEHFYM